MTVPFYNVMVFFTISVAMAISYSLHFYFRRSVFCFHLVVHLFSEFSLFHLKPIYLMTNDITLFLF